MNNQRGQMEQVVKIPASDLQVLVFGVLGFVAILIVGFYLMLQSDNDVLEKCIQLTQKVLECKS